jgi:hypothetical protein
MNEPRIDQAIIRRIEEEEPEIRRIQFETMCCEAFKTLDSATGLTESDPQWLWTLKLRGADALNKKSIARAFIETAQSNSDLWSKGVKAVHSPLNDAHLLQNKKVPWRLLECWLASSGSPFQFSFCYYNDKALAKLIA